MVSDLWSVYAGGLSLEKICSSRRLHFAVFWCKFLLALCSQWLFLLYVDKNL